MKKTLVLLWILTAVLAIFFWFYFPTLTRYRELKIQEEDLSKKIVELDKKIMTLAEERELLKNDPEYLEKVIRSELGLVKPGEIVYKLVEVPRESATVPPATGQEAEEGAGLTETPAKT